MDRGREFNLGPVSEGKARGAGKTRRSVSAEHDAGPGRGRTKYKLKENA